MTNCYGYTEEEFIDELSKSIKNVKYPCKVHDISHSRRVWAICKIIAKDYELCNMRILLPSAILHDIARGYERVTEADHATLGSTMIKDILNKYNEYTETDINEISKCIRTHRYRNDDNPESLEAKILYDADKIDSLGMIGITRSFMFAQSMGQNVDSIEDVEEYKKINMTENGQLIEISRHSPMMEYELKFKHVIDKMFTETGKSMARERLDDMDQFFIKFKNELNIGTVCDTVEKGDE